MMSCADCERHFPSKRAFEQHVRDSPAHAVTYDCDECDRSFDSENALGQHVRDSTVHRRLSPLDSFFADYKDFDYNPRALPSDEMARLRRYYSWNPNGNEARSAWDGYRQALVFEFKSWYGTDNESLPVWRSLCRAVRICPIPDTCAGCRQAVRGRHVNMVDLLHQRRHGEECIQVFDTLEQLRNYTKEHRRYFPKDTLNQGALLKHLLRQIFSE